jgi:hypothetical protein
VRTPLLVLPLLALLLGFAGADEPTGLGGRVTDPLGGALVGAVVQVSGPSGNRKARTDSRGSYTLGGLAAGTYTVTATRDGFTPYGNGSVEVVAGRNTILDIQLELAPVEETVTVKSTSPPVSLEPENNAGAIIIQGKDLDALPDDPDEMLDALQALAGPSAGPNGGQVFIDGFTGGRIPPKASIREIRLNANPFSAEYDRLGYGRIEIFTKPGTDQFRAETSYRFNDDALNARNPYAPNKPPYSRNDWSGSLSGPIVAKKASFFVDFDLRYIDDNQIVNATVLDPDLQPVPYNVAVVTPQHRDTFSPRVDWQINPSQSLTARYTYTENSQDDAGVGGFSLPSRAYDTKQTQQTLELTETGVYGKVINETRMRYWTANAGKLGDDSISTLQVQDSFTGGGPQVGPSTNNERRFELQNVTSFTKGKHSVRAGIRLRTVNENDIARQGFGGTVVFAGGLGPELDENNQVVVGPDGKPVLVPLTSIQRYQRTLFLQQQGLTPQQISALALGPSQYQIVGGSPQATVSQWDIAPFVQDDWKVGPNLLLSLGLRYELQNNIDSHFNFAPRLGFAWSPGAKGPNGQARTVVRGGFGVFYDRFSEDLTLRARRYNGVLEQQYVVSDPRVLNQIEFDDQGNVVSVPSAASLTAFEQPQTTWEVAPNLQSPYIIQSSLSLEQALPRNFTATATFILGQGRRELRSRNINAPLADGTYPMGVDAGNVYQMESTGRLNQYQGILGVNNRLSQKLTLFFRYFLSWAHSDTDSVDTFPANQYDLAGEYGRSALDVRNRIVLGGNISLPGGVRLSPFVLVSSGRPYNITIGRDLNHDSLFTERPAYAIDPNQPGLVATPYGLLDPNPGPLETIIARNLGEAPAFSVVNLRISKTFAFGGQRGQGGGPPPGEGGGRGVGGGRGGFGGVGGGGRNGGGDSGARGLTLSVSAQNLFNHTNPGAPVGNLSSPSFGQSLSSAGGFGLGPAGSSTAGSRRIELIARFAF